MAVFSKSVKLIQTPCLCIIHVYHLKATDQLISRLLSEAMKDVAILREISLKCKNEKLEKFIEIHQTFTKL